MANTYSSIYTHLVFSTKFRKRWIDQEIENRIWDYIGGVAKRNGIRPIEIGGIEDHLHSLLNTPPKIAASEAAKIIKSGSSKWIKRTFDFGGFAWQDGYAAFSMSPSAVEKVRAYIRNQRKHHATKSFEDEYRELLALHQIDLGKEEYMFG